MAAQRIELTLSDTFCEEILKERLRLTYSIDPSIQTLSIDSCVITDAYQQALIIDIPSWPNEYKSIEKSVMLCFDHWAQFWCEYEIHKIRQRYPYQLDRRPNDLSMDESRYHSLFVEGVENSDDLYQTLHHEAPMMLSDAIALINLSTLVLASKWYEILAYLNISREGNHFVLTYAQHDCVNQPDVIVSTARIQSWFEAQQWLYFTPFFRNQFWQLCLPANLNERCLELDLFEEQFNFDNNCHQSFEDSFSAHIIDKNHICEVLRLTVSGTATQGAFFLFLAQKRIMPLLEERQFKLAYTVIEQPWMIHFYETLQHGGYFHSSFRKIGNSDHSTYKGFWVIPSLRFELEELNYQSYKRRVVGRRKEMKEIDYV